MIPSTSRKYFTGRNVQRNINGNSDVPSSTLLQTSSDLNTITSYTGPPDKAAIHYHTFKKLDIWNGISSLEGTGHYLGQPTYSLLTNASPLAEKAIGGFYNNSRIVDAEWGQLERRSLDKLYAQIRNTKSNLTVDIAEGGQTVRMIRQTLQFRKRFVEFVSHVVTQRGYRLIGKRRQAQRRLDYVTNKWLELQYGWRPALSSIYEVADTIRKARVAGPVLIKVRSGHLKNLNGDQGYGSTLDHRVIKQVIGSYRCERGAYYVSPGLQFTDFFSLNPLSVAWELVPYSFVVDWFVNIGQCLENWETYARYRSGYRNGYLTYTTKEDRIGHEFGVTTTPPEFWPNGQIKDATGTRDVFDLIGRCVYKYKERNIVSSLPLPYGPQVKLDLGSNQILSAAALMRQRLIKF